jgi:hypothetical protein
MLFAKYSDTKRMNDLKKCADWAHFLFLEA